MGIDIGVHHACKQTKGRLMRLDASLQGADIKEECLEVEDKVLLSCSASWVSHPDLLLLPYNGRNFEVKVIRLKWLIQAPPESLCISKQPIKCKKEQSSPIAAVQRKNGQL